MTTIHARRSDLRIEWHSTAAGLWFWALYSGPALIEGGCSCAREHAQLAAVAAFDRYCACAEVIGRKVNHARD